LTFPAQGRPAETYITKRLDMSNDMKAKTAKGSKTQRKDTSGRGLKNRTRSQSKPSVVKGPTYKDVAIRVRDQIWKTAGADAFLPDIKEAAKIPSAYRLGFPKPIGMAPAVIDSMLQPINDLIQELRSDHSNNHFIQTAEYKKIITVGSTDQPKETSLVDLVWGKVQP
jgi:hypothetical protein